MYEAAHRLQMCLLAASGQRSAVLAQYILCRTILTEELEITPEDETTALYDAIRRDDYGIRGVIQLSNGVNELTRAGKGQVTDTAVNSSPLYHQQKIKHNLPGQLTSFTGREADLVALSAALLDPNQRLITVIGEGGVRAKQVKCTFTLTAENQAAVLGIWPLVGGSPLAIELPACGVDQSTLQERHAHYYLTLLQSQANQILVYPEAQAIDRALL